MNLQMKCMAIPDIAIKNYFNLLTNISHEELTQLYEDVESKKLLKIDLKKKLAELIITEIFSITEAEQAKAYFENTFQYPSLSVSSFNLEDDSDGDLVLNPGDTARISFDIENNWGADADGVLLTLSTEDERLIILDLAKLPNGQKFAKSISEGRRLITQNAISVNNEKISDDVYLNVGDEVRVGRFKFLRLID